MGLKLKCPACGATVDLDRAEKEAGLAALVKAAALFGPDWDLVSEYLDGFRARPGGALALKKRLRLLREFWEMWSTCRFKFQGEEYQVGREEFRQALAQVANRELTELKNHNYLKTVLKEAARQTSIRLEKEFREKEERFRFGRTGVSGAGVSAGTSGNGGRDARPTPPRGEGDKGTQAGSLCHQVDPEWQVEFKRLNQAVIRAKSPEAKARAQKAFQEHLQRRRDPDGPETDGEQH